MHFWFSRSRICNSKYKINKEKTSIILFGVDTNFWKLSKVSSDEYFFNCQDPSRDFDTLVKTKKYKLKIHTDLRINVTEKI